MSRPSSQPGTASKYGLMAAFDDAQGLITATRKVRDAGYTKLDAYSPYPIEEVSETLETKASKVSLIALAGGLLGCLTGAALQYWTQVYVYPMNVGGRPHNSWPSFIVVCFELTILFAALSAVVGMFLLNRLPMPYHPVFNVESFLAASRDRFFLVVEAADPSFDEGETRRLLESLNPSEVAEVEA